MWKSGFFLRAAILFSPQPDVNESIVFNSFCEEKFSLDLSTDYLSTFHKPCGEKMNQTVTS